MSCEPKLRSRDRIGNQHDLRFITDSCGLDCQCASRGIQAQFIERNSNDFTAKDKVERRKMILAGILPLNTAGEHGDPSDVRTLLGGDLVRPTRRPAM